MAQEELRATMDHDEVDRLVTALIEDPEKVILVDLARFIFDYEARLEGIHQEIAAAEYGPFIPRRAKRLGERSDELGGMHIALADLVKKHAGRHVSQTDSYGVSRWLVHRIRLEEKEQQ